MRITRNRSTLLFLSIVGSMSLSLVGFIQSTTFAGWLKHVMIRYLPSDAGIQGDFSELAIQLFPPGLAIVNPELKLSDRNILDLPRGSEVSAKRLELSFLPFQMLSGKIKIHRVRIVDGSVRAFIEPKKQKEVSTSRLRWEDLLQVRIDSVIFDNTRIEVSSQKPALSAKLVAEHASLDQTGNDKSIVYNVDVRLKEIEGQFPKAWSIPSNLERASAQASISAQGVRFKNLEIANDGLNFQAAGEIKGDVLDESHPLLSTGEISVEGEFDRVAKWLGWKTENVRGRVQLQGQVDGDLTQPEKTLAAEGLLTVKDFAFDRWAFDECLAEAKWKASPAGGTLNVKKLSVMQGAAERVNGKPGRGGVLSVEPFNFTVGQAAPVDLKVDLKGAHIHWLTAPVIKNVFALDFRVSGTALVQATIPRNDREKLALKSQVDFKIPTFVLDNQRLGQVKPQSKVLNTRDLSLKGGVTFNGSRAEFHDLVVAAGKSTALDVGGSVGSQGYDIKAEGPMDLLDVREIAESPVRGSGRIDVNVHGPAANVLVDFDTELDGVEYLGLELGDARGRIVWDDDPEYVRFENVEVRKNATDYTVFGKIDVGQSLADLEVKFGHGRVKDITAIFKRLTDQFWWFPSSLDGDVTGNAKVSGGLSMDRLIVSTEMLGSGWSFSGERFDQVFLEGGYDRGAYLIRNGSAMKRGAQLNGHLSYSKNNEFDWGFKSQGLKLRDIDFFSRLDVPLRGDLKIDSTGKGTIEQMDSSTEISAKSVAVRGEGFADSKVALVSQSGKWSATGNLFGDQGTFDWKKGKATGKLAHFDLSPILILINPKLLFDPLTSGRISGSFDLSELNGRIELGEAWIAKNGGKIALDHPVQIKMSDGSFPATTGSWIGESGEKLEVMMSSQKTRISGHLLGDVSLSLVEFFTSAVQSFKGLAKTDLTLGGTFFQPEVKGVIRTSESTLRVSAIETPFENVAASLRVRNDLLTLEHATADLASGRVVSSGTVELFKDRVPKLDLLAALNGPKIKVYPFQYAKVNGKVTVRGEEIPYWIEGKVMIDGALSREKVLNHSQVQGLRTTNYMPTLSGDSGQSKFRLKIDVVADNGIIVKNDLFDAELKANVTLVNTLDNPRLLGSAEVVNGRLLFKDHIFQIQSATMRFDNPAVLNPQYALTANTEVSGRRVQLYSSGNVDKPKIELTANPAMTESEILSLLAIGVSEDGRKIRSDRSTVEQGEAASLLLHSLDFNRDVQDRTGFEIQLDEAAEAGAATSAFKPRTAETESTAAPKIVIKRKVGKRVELSVGSTVGVGTSSQREVNAEYRFTPAFSVLGVWDTLESVDKSQDRNTSYGLDLKLQKRFK